MRTTTETAPLSLDDTAHGLLSTLCFHVHQRNFDAARPLFPRVHKLLPRALRVRLKRAVLSETVEEAMLGGIPGACCGKSWFCVCCTFDDILAAAGFVGEQHGCKHTHSVQKRRDNSLFVNYDAKPEPAPATVRRVATAMAKPTPGRFAAARYASSDSSSDSGLSSREPSPAPSDSSCGGGRVNKRAAPRARATATKPYARPAPRPSRAVDALAGEMAAFRPFADREVDALVDSLAASTLAPEAHSIFEWLQQQQAAQSAYAYAYVYTPPTSTYTAPAGATAGASSIYATAWPRTRADAGGF
ncbi:hypothetical protein AURDEDRAFT_117925 [Auricularia subglabra TFB-10046 SS5]|uniref:Uncharacterized protein n=1 Tax=Auricularia subglabra (strain TFB-10046 / SS5) TaxID=717982 RepID=J0D372_AURST|nr:hypothetical protein AURDEDRAFT_117925 [Auricularia subglabra TFB-10046 SS5]